MIPSPEYRALTRQNMPVMSEPGDMWLCRRLGIVRVFNGHKRGQSRRGVFNSFHLYHWGEKALWSPPCNWRDGDPNAGSRWDPAIQQRGDERWEYIGNIFAMLPFESLYGRPWLGPNTEK